MRVGKEVQRQVLAEELKKKRTSQLDMSEEERQSLAKALMTLPKDRIVPALRSAGLDKEADEAEQKFAEEHLAELRLKKLDEINGLPVEERLSQLIANGFTDEAKALSEQMAAENEADADIVSDEKHAEKPKKKGGRPKKSK